MIGASCNSSSVAVVVGPLVGGEEIGQIQS
jgi:hypothetical protein